MMSLFARGTFSSIWGLFCFCVLDCEKECMILGERISAHVPVIFRFPIRPPPLFVPREAFCNNRWIFCYTLQQIFTMHSPGTPSAVITRARRCFPLWQVLCLVKEATRQETEISGILSRSSVNRLKISTCHYPQFVDLSRRLRRKCISSLVNWVCCCPFYLAP